ncbi:MAG: hypothetical protein ACRD3G_09770 [Vicinamibacterales bacterium]
MNHRYVVIASRLIAVVAVLCATTSLAVAQTRAYRAPRTPDGQPDLQGFWTNTTYTPLQRPKEVTKELYTREEALEILKTAATLESEQTEPGTIPDVHYDFTQFGLDRNQGGLALNLRTSLIFDPTNGQLPPMTEEGQKRNAVRAEARKRMGGPTDAAQNQSLSVRCILMDRAGPPMLPGAYNNNYQIIQGPGYVMILVEMIHEPRIIPLDGRPHLPPHVRSLTGNPIGRWEGETLVVETTNFNGRNPVGGGRGGGGSSDAVKITERFTRISDDQIEYKFTVDDPQTWTRPWTALNYLQKTNGPIFEFACHETNIGVSGILGGARADEKRAAEAAAAKTGSR